MNRQEFWQQLRNQFVEALREIKQSEEVKVFELGCWDAGNRDYLYIVGYKDHYYFNRITYGTYKVSRNLLILDNWLNEADEGFPDSDIEELEDFFRCQWVTIDYLVDEISSHLEIDEI